MSDFKTTVYPIDRDGEEHEINVRTHYDATYDPGCVSGPAELCYPAYGEMILTDMEILDELPLLITEDDVREAAKADEDRLEQEAWDDFMAHRHSCEEGYDG